MKINKERSENELANYVKFRRGSAEAFKQIDKSALEMDTLYFIYDEDDSTAELYLGSKLIAGGEGSGSGVSALKDLSDVILNAGLSDKDFLVYDASAGVRGAWVNKPLEEAISVMVGATALSSGHAGLVPGPDAGPLNRYLRSDGQWVIVNTQVFNAVNDEKLNHQSVILNATKDSVIANGDIIIVKDVIADNKYSYTAYVYQDGHWAALDGNYNAENVYFDKDFIFTEAIGTVEIPESGNTVVSAAGKNIKEFMASLFAKERDPEVVNPSATMTVQSGFSVEVGSSYTPNYVINFNEGSYSYGPATGVTAIYAVSDTNGSTNTAPSGKLNEVVIGDNTVYKIIATVSYSDGAIPVTNLNNEVADKKIVADTIDLVSGEIKGYRNVFYGTSSSKDALNSDAIRELSKLNRAGYNGLSWAMNIPVGAVRVVIAYDAKLQDLTSVFDKNDSNANIVSGFGDPYIIKVEGANNYDGIDYKVYVLDFAIPYDVANIFTVTI